MRRIDIEVVDTYESYLNCENRMHIGRYLIKWDIYMWKWLIHPGIVQVVKVGCTQDNNILQAIFE